MSMKTSLDQKLPITPEKIHKNNNGYIKFHLVVFKSVKIRDETNN